MKARLEIPGGRLITLKEKTTIGRDAACDVPVLDPLVANSQVEICRLPDGHYLIRDQGGASGVLVGGERISECILRDGDEITLGRTRLTFRGGESSYRPPEPSGEVKRDQPLYLHSFPEIESVWQNGGDFLKAYQASGTEGRFFHPVSLGENLPAEARVGALLTVNLKFLDRQADFVVHARVLERRTIGEPRGLSLEFLPEEKERRELVLACAGGASFPYFRRRYERTPCRLPVRINLEKDRKLDSMAIEISPGGIGLVPNHTLEKEMNVSLDIFFPGARKPLVVRGRVAAVIQRGPRQGVGVEFLFDSPEQRDEIKYQVSLIRSRWSE